MKITLLQVDKTDEKWLSEGIEKYVKRLRHYVDFEVQILEINKNIRSRSLEEQKREEGRLLLKALEKCDYIILLDEKGKGFTSPGFAKFMEKTANEGRRQVAFVIGGPFGFSEEVYTAAHQKICLSEMTFSHQMIRLFFCEQLYRAYSILRGEKYHHL